MPCRKLRARAFFLGISGYGIEIFVLFIKSSFGLKLGQATVGLNFERHFCIVCKGVKHFLTLGAAVSGSADEQPGICRLFKSA
jgi:hypothetical protein